MKWKRISGCVVAWAISVACPSMAAWGQDGVPRSRRDMAPLVDSSNTDALLANLRQLTDESAAGGQASGGHASSFAPPVEGTGSLGAVGSGTSCGGNCSGGSCGLGDWDAGNSNWCGTCDSECDSGCGACGDCGGSCFPDCGGCYSGIELFGEYLHLRSSDAEVAYAVPVDGPLAQVLGNGIQAGQTAVVDPGRQGGFRIGMSAVNTACGRVIGQWTHFESSEEDSVTTAAPDVVRSLVTHPLGNNVATDGRTANANYDIDFDLVDLAAETPWVRNPCWAWDLLWGVRYGQLSQNFSSTVSLNGNTNVATDIDFNGVGPRLGLLGQKTIGRRGFYLLGRGEASFLVGTFDAAYQQRSDFGGLLVDTSWQAGRIMPQLEMELGVGFASPAGRFQMRAGYLVSSWYNAVTTDEYIHAVQLNDPRDLGNGMVFDGLVVRGEVRF